MARFSEKCFSTQNFWFVLQLSPEKFLAMRRNERDMIENVCRSSCEVPVILETWIFSTYFRKILLLLLFMKRYNPCKVLACPIVLFQLSLSCATFFQLPKFILLICFKTSSSQRVLGLPIGLLDMGFHLLIFWTLLSSAMISTWPN